MPVTSQYSWFVEEVINPAAGDSNNPALAALSNGGFVMVRDNGATTIGTIHDENGDVTGSWVGTAGTNPSVTQIDNGNIVVVTQDADSIVFEIYDTNGMLVAPITDIGDINSTNPVVTSIANGFAISNEDNVITDNIDTRFFDSTGVELNDINTGVAPRDENNPTIVTLTNGNVATAWTEVGANGLEVRFAIAQANGAAEVVSNTFVETVGLPAIFGAIPSGPSLASTALPNGSFALVYRNNEVVNGGMSLAIISAAGIILNRFDITGDTQNPQDINVSVLANGYLAVAFTELTRNPVSGDIENLTLVRIVDPATGAILPGDHSVVGANNWNDETNDPALTTLANGDIVVVHEALDAEVEGEILSLVRTTNGDDTSNVFMGDELIDVATGGADADFFFGMEGDDRLFGRGGDDWLYGGEGNDRLDGDEGNDLLFGEAGDDEINGGTGGDFLYGGDGDDVLTGEDGNDWLYGEADTDVLLGLAGDDALFGGTGDDQILGGTGTDTIFGEDGDDDLFGEEGGDVISGQVGNDQIQGGAGGDFLFGGEDDDTIFGGEGVDQLWGGSGEDYLNGGQDNDDIYGEAGSDQLFGAAGVDSLFGGDDNDWLYGGADGDVLNGGGSNDQLYGDEGGDFLFGDAGSDTLNGGAGNDQLFGGSNGMAIAGEADTFVFDQDWGNDTVYDYEAGVDNVVIIGTSGVLDDFGDLTVTQVGSDTIVSSGADSITFLGVDEATILANSTDFTILTFAL